MKLSAKQAASHFARPDPSSACTLIYGANAMRVALKRQELVSNLIGPKGDEEMRFSRIPAGDLRKEPSRLIDALRAQSFFAGPRAVLVEDAADAQTKVISAALDDHGPGDAHMIVTAGALNARSSLRKAFEAAKSAFAVGIYNDPPSREELEAELTRAGLKNIDREAMTDLMSLSRSIDPGDLRQTVEKLALFKLGDVTPVTSTEVAACAPQTTEAAMDDMLNIVAESRTGEIGPVMSKLEGQGVNPTTLCIGATRHFRTLFAAASDPGGPSAGIARARPPVFGPRRDRMIRQTQAWGTKRLEKALQMLTDTDLELRSAGQTAPQMALIERAMIRLAMLGAARR